MLPSIHISQNPLLLLHDGSEFNPNNSDYLWVFTRIVLNAVVPFVVL